MSISDKAFNSISAGPLSRAYPSIPLLPCNLEDCRLPLERTQSTQRATPHLQTPLGRDGSRGMGKSMWVIPPERLCLCLETLPWLVPLGSKLCHTGTRRSRSCEQRTSPRLLGDSPAVLPGGSVSLRMLQRGRACPSLPGLRAGSAAGPRRRWRRRWPGRRWRREKERS